MALRSILGITVGLAAALGGAALAAKRLFGSDEANGQYRAPDSGAGSGVTPPPAPPREGLDPTLLEILACPDDKQPVIYQKEGDAERLTCTKCGKRYPVRDGIPVMLIDEAESGPLPTEQEVAAAKALAPEGKPAVVGAAAGGAAGAIGAGGAGGAAEASGAAQAPSTAGATGGAGASAPAHPAGGDSPAAGAAGAEPKAEGSTGSSAG